MSCLTVIAPRWKIERAVFVLEAQGDENCVAEDLRQMLLDADTHATLATIEKPAEARHTAPVQGWPAGIPWSLHLEAYAAYCKQHGEQPALIQGWCRGGFGTRELDVFIPGWRERVSEITKLREEVERLRAAQQASPAAVLTPEQIATIADEMFDFQRIGDTFPHMDRDEFREIAGALIAAAQQAQMKEPK